MTREVSNALLTWATKRSCLSEGWIKDNLAQRKPRDSRTPPVSAKGDASPRLPGWKFLISGPSQSCAGTFPKADSEHAPLSLRQV